MDYTVHGILQARMNTEVSSHSLLQGIFPTQRSAQDDSSEMNQDLWLLRN